MMNNTSSQLRRAALNEINQISFVVDELRLYLDTHPMNRRAADLFRNYVEQRETLVKSYELKYGPLQAYSLASGNVWQWNEPPMPWEGDY